MSLALGHTSVLTALKLAISSSNFAILESGSAFDALVVAAPHPHHVSWGSTGAPPPPNPGNPPAAARRHCPCTWEAAQGLLWVLFLAEQPAERTRNRFAASLGGWPKGGDFSGGPPPPPFQTPNLGPWKAAGVSPAQWSRQQQYHSLDAWGWPSMHVPESSFLSTYGQQFFSPTDVQRQCSEFHGGINCAPQDLPPTNFAPAPPLQAATSTPLHVVGVGVQY